MSDTIIGNINNALMVVKQMPGLLDEEPTEIVAEEELAVAVSSIEGRLVEAREQVTALLAAAHKVAVWSANSLPAVAARLPALHDAIQELATTMRSVANGVVPST